MRSLVYVRRDLDALAEGEQFVPVVLELPAPINPATAKVWISYSGDDPLGVTVDVEENTGITTYAPGPGEMRLWTKDGDQERDGTGVDEGGDYVWPGREYDRQGI